jgi:hypothetical protein
MIEVIPVSHRNAEVNIQSATSGRPAENVPENHFPRGCTGQEISCFMLVCNFIDLSDGFENDRIDLMLNF